MQSASSSQQPMLDYHLPFPSFNSSEATRSSPIRGFLTFPHSSSLHSDKQFASNTLMSAERLKFDLSSLLPPNADFTSSSLKERITVLNTAFGCSIYGMVIFSAENNFAGLDGDSIGLVLEFLKQDSHMRSKLLQYHRVASENISKALAQNMVRAAIENSDAATLREYLSMGLVSSNEIVCLVNGRRYTAVERSAMLHSYEVTEVLIHARADLAKTYEKDQRMERGPLELAVGKFGNSRPADERLIDLLLHYGAEVCIFLIVALVSRKDTILIEQLLSKVSPSTEHSKAMTDHMFMFNIVFLPDCRLAMIIIKKLVEMCFATGCRTCCESQPELMQGLLSIAAIRGHLELVSFLAKYVTDITCSLVAAVRGGHRDTIEYLLKAGAKLDSPASNLIDSIYMGRLPTALLEAFSLLRIPNMSTPLAEAIRAKVSRAYVTYVQHYT